MSTLYVSDLDGTLLTSEKEITKETSSILNKLIEAGISVSIATARTPATVKTLLKDIHFKLPVVLMNGAVLYDLNKEEYIDVEYIEKQKVKQLFNLIGADKSKAFIYTIQDNQLIVYVNKSMNCYQKEFFEERKNKYNKTFIVDDNFKVTDQVAYFAFLGEKEEIEAIYNKVKYLPGFVMSFYREMYIDNAYILEIYSDRGTKANAILKLKHHKNFNKLVCFGDNVNDLSMFEIADEGIAVGNAVEEVKEAATKVIGENNANGVANYLKEKFKEMI